MWRDCVHSILFFFLHFVFWYKRNSKLFFVFWYQRNNKLFDKTVAAVPDGLKAWETLKERPHNIDLVLTEVELPSISGYALLTLIVEHDLCKNIPVISMFS